MKTEIRKRVLKTRNSLSDYEIHEKSDIIIEKFKKTNFYDYTKIIIYMSTKSEVFTHSFVIENFRKKEIFVPVIDNDTMFMSRVCSPEFKKNSLGILEPIECDNETKLTFQESGEAVLIVPGVAFDLNKNRIGYGKGYYDRFDIQCKISIGFAFECQIVDFIPTEPHDKKVDIIITEKRIIS